ncbi:MAG: hypothetical protein CVU65_13845 [Deltaproteobacteria bacterium HGW-Deltaproteobacteria-22]|jgi:formylglycine-generating enzyme required for sulfatase activity|nr:MAG: hypothetical protein CVU65_13845 [Deltaproteobacteria bacterium HGW-Deltaproteobacteria-22]
MVTDRLIYSARRRRRNQPVSASSIRKAFAGSTGSNVIDEYAWYTINSGNTTHPVGTKLPNELGLYDLSGNVFEWAWDWNGTYPMGIVTDYRGAASNSQRIERGGAFRYSASAGTVTYRDFFTPYGGLDRIGFRVVRP